MIVFAVVEEIEYDTQELLGIFTTKVKAVEFVSELISKSAKTLGDFCIYESLLDGSSKPALVLRVQ
jgi:hypothetical protein